MKKRLLVLFLLPAFAFGQTKTYYSADLSGNFGKYLEYTGYGVDVSGNIRLFEKMYGGVSTGIVQVKPFINHLAIPLAARLTFFTSYDEEKIAPFGLFEAGKLFYNEENFGGSSSQVMKGEFTFFTGVGVKLSSAAKKTHLFFAIGYAGYNYGNNRIGNQGASEGVTPYHYRRVAIRAGFMLPR